MKLNRIQTLVAKHYCDGECSELYECDFQHRGGGILSAPMRGD